MDLFDKDKNSGTRPGNKSIVTVVPLRPLNKGYTYRIPAGVAVPLGSYVRVPIGNTQVLGVVWDAPPDKDVPENRLKDIAEIFDMPPMPKPLRRFVEWVAAYTLCPVGQVLKMTVAGELCVASPKNIKAYRLTDDYIAHMQNVKQTKPRARVLECLETMGAGTVNEIASEAGVSAGVVKGLEESGVILGFTFRHEEKWSQPIEKLPNLPELSAIQKKTADALVILEKNHKFGVTVLDGVTGSGKTEVYFAPVRSAVSAGYQVLVLVPEIALTQQFLSRFKKRFGVEPAQWHSNMTPSQRRKVWRGVARGEIQVVVGARSALFLPFEKLGLIIVDEEHDPSYKQEEGGTIYHARDMAIVRGKHDNCAVILVSATPSLETVQNVWDGKYHEYHLPERHGGATLPDVNAIDMREEKLPRQSWISLTLLEAMRETLAKDEQVLLFLNRRGYAPLTLCRTCGTRLSCPQCTSWLVEHKMGRKLICHHCGYTQGFPEKCPECETEDSLASCGPGVERIHEEVLNYFPNASVCVLSSDIQRTPQILSEILTDIAGRQYDIIIGTQIIAKGHHFPSLTLVGVVDADLGLSGSDLRAGERTFQLLQQVSGRAGREKQQGKVYLQTYSPEHPLMAALVANDRDRFYQEEMKARQQAFMPPYSRLVGVVIAAEKDGEACDFACAVVKKAPLEKDVTLLGPAPAIIHQLRGLYRYRILVRCPKDYKIQTYMRAWLEGFKLPKKVSISIDVDPYSFF